MTKLPWPKRGDKAFAPADDGKYFHLPKQAYLYLPQHADAFQLAAEMILDAHLESDSRFNHDELIFPVAYLYRHCIELQLKRIIDYGRKLDLLEDSEKLQEVIGGHNLAKLWTRAKFVINAHWEDAEQNSPKAVEAIINEFHQVDPNGQVFRYSRDKDNKPHQYEGMPSSTDVANLRDTMAGVLNFFGGCIDGLDHSLEAMMDMQRDMRDNYY